MSSVLRLLSHSGSAVVDRKQQEAHGDCYEEPRENKVKKKKKFCAVEARLEWRDGLIFYHSPREILISSSLKV